MIEHMFQVIKENKVNHNNKVPILSGIGTYIFNV